MTYSTASAPPRPVSPMLAAIARPLAMTVALSLPLSVAANAPAFAQQQETAPAPGAAPAAPAAKPKPAPKKPKPAAQTPPPAQAQQPPPAAAPLPQPGQAPAPEQGQAPGQGQAQGQGQGGQQQVQLIYSPWTKFCLKGQEAAPKQVCFTGKDARIESGMPVVAAVLIEPEGQERKVLRVTLPLGMQLVHGTRVIIDQNQPMTAPYVICFTNGCMADYEANADMIGKMKKGQGLVVQAINSTGQPISLALPLADFAKAYDGPPTDPKVFEEQQRKLQEELQRRADEARKKLENQQGAPQSQAPATPAPAPQAGKTQ